MITLAEGKLKIYFIDNVAVWEDTIGVYFQPSMNEIWVKRSLPLQVKILVLCHELVHWGQLKFRELIGNSKTSRLLKLEYIIYAIIEVSAMYTICPMYVNDWDAYGRPATETFSIVWSNIKKHSRYLKHIREYGFIWFYQFEVVEEQILYYKSTGNHYTVQGIRDNIIKCTEEGKPLNISFDTIEVVQSEETTK